MRPLEATYLAWIDLRAYGVDDPAAVALAHGVRLAPGHDYQPGLTGHVRLNIATSPDRLERDRATGWRRRWRGLSAQPSDFVCAAIMSAYHSNDRFGVRSCVS